MPGTSTLVSRGLPTRPEHEPVAPQEADRPGPSAPSLPIVSVVIVNFNYGRYLRQAIDSVFDQTYPRVECIVVDNGSTDHSSEVINAAAACHPTMRVINLASNDGQSAASMTGFAQSAGCYVVFLDADDYLLPHCIATHICVHLAARIHVGMTCGDMLQVVDDQVVLSTNEPMATFVLGRQKPRPGLLRPTAAALGALWQTFDQGLTTRLHLVSPRQKDWVWSPTSGNCFRRDALALFLDNPDLAQLRSQTDLYLAFGINAVCGSILIDEPLFVYRLHGANVFTNRAQLAGFLSHDPKATVTNHDLARRLLVDQMITHVDRFVQDRWLGFAFLRALLRIDVANRDTDGRSHAALSIGRNFAAVGAATGEGLALLFLLYKRAPLKLLWRATRCLLAAKKRQHA